MKLNFSRWRNRALEYVSKNGESPAAEILRNTKDKRSPRNVKSATELLKRDSRFTSSLSEKSWYQDVSAHHGDKRKVLLWEVRE